MPTITITLKDTPAGGVSVHSNFEPAVGACCSPAQAEALDILLRTRTAWGIKQDTAPRPIDYCVCDLEPTIQEFDTGRCMCCGKVQA